MKKTSNPVRFDVGEEVRVTVLNSIIINDESGKNEWGYKEMPIVSLMPAKIGCLQAVFILYDIKRHPSEKFTCIITGRHGRWQVYLDGTNGLVFIVGCAYRGYLTFLAEMLKQLGAEEYDENKKWNYVTNEEIDKDVWRHDLIEILHGMHKQFDETSEQIEQYLESFAKEPYSRGDMKLHDEILADLWFLKNHTYTNDQSYKNKIAFLYDLVETLGYTEYDCTSAKLD